MEWQTIRLTFLKNEKVELLFRWVLGCLFLFSSYEKLLDPRAFGQVLLGYELFSFPLIVLSANVFPLLEVFCGLSLIFGMCPKEGAALVAGLLTFFIMILAINLFRGIEHDCGCFSSESSGAPPPLWIGILRNLFLLSLAAFIFRFNGQRIACLDRFLGSR